MTTTVTNTQRKKRITIIGAAVNLVLSILKIFFGWLGQSHALIADGFHSLSDLISDVLVYYASHHSSLEADEKHPYGHARFETLATVILGGLLIAVSGAIIWDAIARAFSDAMLTHGWLVIGVAVLSILSKEVLYHLTMRTAKKTKSALLKANAWHHRSDAISSFVVLIGVGLQMSGYRYFDSIAALVVGLMVAKIGYDLLQDASKELVDTGLDTEVVEKISSIILSVDGVLAQHFLRTRKMGNNALVDVHILVDPMISISEGHLISETVRMKLIREIGTIGEVTVHIDPEDDELSSPSLALPLRNILLAKLKTAWEGIEEVKSIKRINLHYLEGRVIVEIELPLALCVSEEKTASIKQTFEENTLLIPEVVKTHIMFS